MTARELEAKGITTVVIGSAMDIVTWCNVPRYLHNDLPLGNPLGCPGDREGQRQSVERALDMAVDLQEPGVRVSPLQWSGDPDWKSVYARVTDENREHLMRLGDENRRARLLNKEKGLTR